MIDLPLLKSLTSIAPIRTLLDKGDTPPFDKLFIERYNGEGKRLSNGIVLTVSKDVKPDVDIVIDNLRPPFRDYRGEITDTLRECFTLCPAADLSLLNFASIIHPDGIHFKVSHGRLSSTTLPIDYIHRLFTDLRYCLRTRSNCKVKTVDKHSITLSQDQAELTAYKIAYYFYRDTTELK
jgi:hypothetical protein